MGDTTNNPIWDAESLAILTAPVVPSGDEPAVSEPDPAASEALRWTDLLCG